MTSPLNAFTVDVEDYFQVENFARQIDRASWDHYPSRVTANTRRVMALLERHGVRATFFILTWNAERHPELVREIAAHGHEVASHGYSHRLVYEQEPSEFAIDVARARAELERLAETRILGYRAPSYSITDRSRWAFAQLKAAGYRYDSSIYPIHRRRYGIAGAPRFPHRLAEGLIEFPMTTLRVARVNLPAASGGYLRILPLAVSIAAVAQLNRAGHPAVVNVHPWELDPEQPRLKGGTFGGFTHYANLAGTADRLAALLGRFRFGTMRAALESAGFALGDGVEPALDS
jgi:polysaccharide deacetylase family protein (PEP-CTERM system associated)